MRWTPFRIVRAGVTAADPAHPLGLFRSLPPWLNLTTHGQHWLRLTVWGDTAGFNGDPSVVAVNVIAAFPIESDAGQGPVLWTLQRLAQFSFDFNGTTHASASLPDGSTLFCATDASVTNGFSLPTDNMGRLVDTWGGAISSASVSLFNGQADSTVGLCGAHLIGVRITGITPGPINPVTKVWVGVSLGTYSQEG